MPESSSTQDKDTRPTIRSIEELMAAPTVDTPDTLLSERGEMVRELGRRVMMPLPDLLRERGA